jgi:oligopeptide transport system substrate-binding protein
MRRLLPKLVFSSLLLLTFLPACQKEKPNQSQLTLNLEKDLNSLDPHQVRLLREISLTRHLYEGLMRADEKGIPRPALAKSVEHLSPIHLRFHLKESTWNDSSPLTADHFVEAWRTALTRATAAPLVSLMFPIKNAKALFLGDCTPEELGVDALDPLTLDVHFEFPTPFFTELTTLPPFFPKLGEKTNGPYLLKEWKRNEKLVLGKNPCYWDHESVTLDEICFSMIEDPTTEQYLFEKGELCWMGQPLSHTIPPEALTFLKEKISHLPIDGTFWVVCNTQKAPLSDQRVREALSLAIDRETLIAHLLGGGQLPARSPIPPGMKLSSKESQNVAQIEKAQALYQNYLKDGGTSVAITLNYQPQDPFRRLAQYLQQTWQKNLGVTIHLEAMEKQLLNAKEREGKCELSLGEWFADFHHPYAFFNLFEEPGGYLNTAKWDDEPFRVAVKQGLYALDPDEQKKYFAQAEERMAQQLPVIPLYHHSFDYIKGDAIEDVVLSPLGCADFKKARRHHR